MKSKVLTAMLIVVAFAIGMMVANGKQEAQASVDLSALYSQLDTMQAKLDNLSVACQRECEEYTLPDFKATEFVTVAEVVVVTDTVVLTEYLTEVVYRDTVITDYIDVPVCNEPEAPQVDTPEAPQVDAPEEPKSDTPEVNEPEVPQTENEPDTPQVDDTPKDKGKCNQGVGNGDEGCDPGNSNHNQPSNDEKTEDGKVPGSPGRQKNPNGYSDDKPTTKPDKSKGKSEEVKAEKPDKEKGKKSS